MMRLDSMFVGFMGRGNGTAKPTPFLVVATAVQNVRHPFSDDSMQIPKPYPALGIYLSSVQPTLSDSQHGVRLNANTGTFPEYGRNFSNVNGMGYSARNIYSRRDLGSPTRDRPISVRWTVRKVKTVTNPPLNLSRAINGMWVPLIGTFVRWNFEIAINGAVANVADYYLPVERAQYIRLDDPLALIPEHLGSADKMLQSQKSALRIKDIWASDGAQWYPLTEWTLTSCIDDASGNTDLHYGWRSDGESLIDSVGHDDDPTISIRASGSRFSLRYPSIPAAVR